MDEYRSRHPSAKVIVCGDFNQLDTQEQVNVTQVTDFPTHGNNTLDLIMTDLTQHYLPAQAIPPLERSPHLSVTWRPTPTTAHLTRHDTKTYRPLTDSATRLFGQWNTQHHYKDFLQEEYVHRK